MKLTFLRKLDTMMASFLQRNAILCMSVLLIIFCIWDTFTAHYFFVLGIILIGFLSYYLSIIIALLLGFLFSILSFFYVMFQFKPLHIESIISFGWLELISYLLVTWLGYQHRQKKEYLMKKEYTDQTLSWNVMNDIRTSLAAVRYLLFPIQDQENMINLNQAKDELIRLETLFKNMDK